jgi:hypothetical protein
MQIISIIIGFLIIFATFMLTIAALNLLPHVLGWPAIALLWAGTLWLIGKC